jgi:hypothetical protein
MAPKRKTAQEITDEHVPHGKHFSADGRKVKDLPRVGAMSPDADPEQQRPQRRRKTARR